MLILIDNYDSFTFNLVQSFQKFGIEIKVIRGQSLTVKECLSFAPRYLVIGPGPGTPSKAFLSKDLMIACTGKIPILGICLGHQAIAEIHGGTVVRAKKPMHGKTSTIFHNNKGIFQHIPQGFEATRYHSLIINRELLPDSLEVTAQTESGEIMGVKHKNFFLEGVQFHPESILTEWGHLLLENFLTFKS